MDHATDMSLGYATAIAMRESGGFIACIGLAWTKGDDKQRVRLEREFEPEFARYRDIARRET